MRVSARQVRIAAKAQLRRAGLIPWLAFLGWVLFCAAQEPAALRPFGVLLREPAAWTGASALWLVCAGPKQWRGCQFSTRCATNLLLLLMVAVTTTLVLGLLHVLVADFADMPPVIASAGWFVVALAPVAAALSVDAGHGSATSPQSILAKALTIASLGPAASVLSACWVALDPPTLFAASGLSLCASLLRMIAATGEPGLQMTARKQT